MLGRLRQIKLNFHAILFVVFSALSVHAFLNYLASLRQMIENKWPIEYNSFYYLVELRQYNETGSGYYSPFLPFFFIFSKIQTLFSLNEVEIYNGVVILSFLVFAIGLSALAYDRKRLYVIPALIYIFLSSRMLFFAHYSFLKQAAGVAALASFLGFAHLAHAAQRKTWKIWAISLACLSIILAAAFHKFSGLLVILFLLIPYEKKLPHHLKKGVLAISAILFAILLIQKYPDGSDIFAVYWPPIWFGYFANAQISPFEMTEYIGYTAMGLIFLGVLIWNRIKASSVILATLVHLGLTLPFFIPGTWRFTLSGAWLLMIALGLFQASDDQKLSRTIKDFLLFAFASFVLINTVICSKEPRLIGPAIPISAIENHIKILDIWLPKDAVVIAPHGVQFRVKYFLNREATRRRTAGNLPDTVYTITNRDGSEQDCVNIATFRGDAQKINCFALDRHWKIFRGT